MENAIEQHEKSKMSEIEELVGFNGFQNSDLFSLTFPLPKVDQLEKLVKTATLPELPFKDKIPCLTCAVK